MTNIFFFEASLYSNHATFLKWQYQFRNAHEADFRYQTQNYSFIVTDAQSSKI